MADIHSYQIRNFLDEIAQELTAGGPDGQLKVVSSPVRGAFTDRSGTLAAAGVAQTVAAAAATRTYFLFQNLSTADLWINFGVAAVQSQPSIKVPAGGSFVLDGNFCSTESISVIGGTLSQAFTSKEAI